jgi:hypothetical protein
MMPPRRPMSLPPVPTRPDPITMADAESADPFSTATLRSAVLSAWSASPDRFREDANAEESLSRGYTDRALVELASNSVDAARDAGVPARIRISLRGNEIRLANTGEPLTRAGVWALASLRASAKRDRAAAVGHFGVGFTAVLAISAAPRVISTSGGIEFSADRTADCVTALDLPGLTAELTARSGVLPTLRLCWPAKDEDPLPEGFTTEVRLPLRDGIDGAALMADWRRAAIDHVFWALPELRAVEFHDGTIYRRSLPDHRVQLVELAGPAVRTNDPHHTQGTEPSAPDVRTAEVSTTPVSTAHVRTTQVSTDHLPTDHVERSSEFVVVTAAGELPESLLAGRPVEERNRSGWRISWVLPTAPAPGPLPLCAPTPTDELLSFPARLVGTFGVDDTRRHLIGDSVDDFLLERAVTGYLDLVMAVGADRRWLLVPPSGFPAGGIDARLRAAVVRELRQTPVLHTALGEPVTPGAAVTVRGVDGRTTRLLAEAMPGLLPAPTTAAESEALRAVGVEEVRISEAVDALASISRPAAFWYQVYEGLASFDSESLAGIPVPLADGRQVLGARGSLLPDAGTAPLAARASAVLPGLRMVHPAAAHPLLRRLGAEPADADTLLAGTELRDQISRCAQDLQDGRIAPSELDEAALTIPTAAGQPSDSGSDRPFAGQVAGDPAAAGPAAIALLVLDLIAAGGRGDPTVLGELVLSDSTGEPWPSGGLMLPDSALRSLMSEQDLPTVHPLWIDRWGAEVLTAAGVRNGLLVIAVTDPRADVSLPDIDDWLTGLSGGSHPQLDNSFAVGDLDLITDWPAFLALLAVDPQGRTALLDEPSYTAWWLRRHVRIDGVRPSCYHLPEAQELAGLFDPLPIALDNQVAAAIGVLTDLGSAIERDPQTALSHFCDPGRRIHPSLVPAITTQLVTALTARADLELPSTVRTLSGAAIDAGEVVVPDGPWWAGVLGPDRLAAPGPDPSATAEVWQLDLAHERWEVSVGTSLASSECADPQQLRVWIDAVRGLLRIESGLPSVVQRADLSVRLDAGDPLPVGWWPAPDGSMLVDGRPESVADALAWMAGRYGDRELARAAVRGDAGRAITEAAFTGANQGNRR